LYGPLQLFTAEFFTTALGMPFEVGKTLLQIEYRPRKRFVPIEEIEVKGAEGERDWGAEDDEVSERASNGDVSPSGLFEKVEGFGVRASVQCPDRAERTAEQPRRGRRVLHRPYGRSLELVCASLGTRRADDN
jgi:hypothetical protein